MHDDMKKIVELSDCEWIRDRWKVKEGDLYFFRINKRLFVIHGKPDMNKDCCIWLPVGFNPESCRLQIDDLLIEIFDKAGCGFLPVYLRGMFLKWVGEKCNIMKNVHLIDESDIILKLTWLRELIEKEK